jgi:hypothetical protein
MRYNYLSLFSLLTWILASSCRVEEPNKIVLSDSIERLVLDYVQENNIEVSWRVITIRTMSGHLRSDIYLSNTQYQTYRLTNKLPAYYTAVNDSIVVFLYSGLEQISARADTSQALQSIERFLEVHQVQLEEGTLYFSHEPVWWYSVCRDNKRLIKQWSLFEVKELPCGYSVWMNEQKPDSLLIIRDWPK